MTSNIEDERLKFIELMRKHTSQQSLELVSTVESVISNFDKTSSNAKSVIEER